MVLTNAARGSALLGAETLLLWQKDFMVINEGLRRADGLKTATVGAKAATQHGREAETWWKWSQVEIVFESLGGKVEEAEKEGKKTKKKAE